MSNPLSNAHQAVHGVPAGIILGWTLNLILPGGKISTWADLGCGDGVMLSSIGASPERGVAVDLYADKNLLPPGFSHIAMSIDDWIRANQHLKFDVISLFDVIEHFPKEEALVLIRRVQPMARAVLITTPAGFLKQDPETDPALSDKPGQWHRSGFEAPELEELGFFVTILRNAHLRPPGNTKSFDKLIGCWLTPSMKKPPQLRTALRLLCWRYNLNPLHAYRTLRDTFIRPLIP